MKKGSKLLRLVVIFFLGTLAAVIFIHSIARAENSLAQPDLITGQWYVTPDGNDSNSCLSAGSPCATINSAIAKASPGDLILVATGIYTNGSAFGIVQIDKSIFLSGGWDSSFTNQTGFSTIDGEMVQRGLIVSPDPDVNLNARVDQFIIQHGYGDRGGGVQNGLYINPSNPFTLTISGSIIRDNTAFDLAGGGIYNYGILILNNTLLDGNSASTGGGIGSAFDAGTMQLNDTIVENNSGGGIYSYGGNGGIVLNRSSIRNNSGSGMGGYVPIVVNNSSINGNKSINDGGGISSQYDLTLNNSTISGNSAQGNGGGIYHGQGALILNNTTVTGNSAAGSGGGFFQGAHTATIQNSIVAGNTAGSGSPDCSESGLGISSAGYNLIGNTTGCLFTPATGDLVNVNPKLARLIGQPGYHPLIASSPAIDAGNPAGCTSSTGPLTADQRGVSRDGHCDIGAFEYVTPGPAASITAVSGTPQHAPPLTSFSEPLLAIVQDIDGNLITTGIVTYTAPASGPGGSFASSGTYSSTVPLNEYGLAQASTFTNNAQLGIYSVMASMAGVSTPATFTLGTNLRHVSASGLDLNDCLTPATACATITGALSKQNFLPEDKVLVGAGTYQGTGDNVVILDKSVHLLGGWNIDYTAQTGAAVIDGQNARRGLQVTAGVTVTLEGFVIRNGMAPVLNGGHYGGGVYNAGSLTLSNSTITQNSALETEFEPAGGGGIYNLGTLSLNNVTIGNNSASGGGGIVNTGNLTVNSSTISRNHSISNYAYGTSFAGGIATPYGTSIVQNTLLSDNTADVNPDCDGYLTSGGYNLITNLSDCIYTSGPGDLTNIKSRLWVASLFGSPGVYPLLFSSPAIDAGNPAGCKDDLGNPLNTDERGLPRVGRCDMGAYEFDLNHNPLIQAYLPVLKKSYPGISGRVTLNGNQSIGVPLELRFFDGAVWSTISTTTTQAGGYYSFTGVPGLGPGQVYYVLYQNEFGDPGRLWVWGTRELTAYSAGSDVTIGNFDIADIALNLPENDVSVSLPVIFQWTPRPATPTDSYEFDIYDPDDEDPYFYTDPPLGYVGAYGMTGLPTGFKFNVPYVWEVWVYSPDGGFGISYWSQWVTFSKSALNQMSAMPPVRSKPVMDPEIWR